MFPVLCRQTVENCFTAMPPESTACTGQVKTSQPSSSSLRCTISSANTRKRTLSKLPLSCYPEEHSRREHDWTKSDAFDKFNGTKYTDYPRPFLQIQIHLSKSKIHENSHFISDIHRSNIWNHESCGHSVPIDVLHIVRPVRLIEGIYCRRM